MHFVLHARHRRPIAVGVELVVQCEHHAQRVFSVRSCLHMPNDSAQKLLPFTRLYPQICHVIQICNIRAELQQFTRVPELRIFLGINRRSVRGGGAERWRRSTGDFVRSVAQTSRLRNRGGRERRTPAVTIPVIPEVRPARAGQQRQNRHHSNYSESHACLIPALYPSQTRSNLTRSQRSKTRARLPAPC